MLLFILTDCSSSYQCIISQYNTNPRHVKKHITVAAKYFLVCMLSIVVFLTGSLNLDTY